MVGSNVFRGQFFSLFLPLTVYLLFLLFPFYWMLIVSFKPTNDLFEMKFNPFWIQQFTLENYLYLFQNTDFPSWLKNTLIVSVVSTTLSLICSVFIGYALARLRFPGSNFLGVGIFLAYLVPPTLLFLPLAQVISSFGLNNTYWALIHLSHPADSFCLLALDGVLPHDSKRNRRKRHGRRLLRASRSCTHGFAAFRPGPPFRRDFLFYPLLE